MKVALDIPEDIARRLHDRWEDLPRQAAEVGSLLGLSSRWEVDDLLVRSGVPLHYSEADFSEDLQRLRATS